MAPIPPGRAAARTAPVVLVVSLALGGLLYLQGDPRPAIAATLVCVVVMGVVVGQAPARLAWRLGEFASQVPGEPDATVAWRGEQTLEWPDLGLTVEGNIHRYRLQDFAVHTGDDVRYLAATRPREAARTALEELGEAPAFAGPDDRLPSLYPRLAGLLTGFLGAVLAGIAVGLGGPVVAGGVHPLWWWTVIPAVGVLAGGTRWLGLAHARRCYRGVADDLYERGVEVDRMDRTGGRIRIAVTVHTDVGGVPTRCVAVPYGLITATDPTDPDEAVAGRLPDPTPLADGIAQWRRHG